MLQEFLQYLATVRRFSPLTVQNYRRDVTNFLEWLDVPEADFDPRRITVEDVREWIVHRYGNKTSGSRLDEPGALLPAEFLPLPPPYGANRQRGHVPHPRTENLPANPGIRSLDTHGGDSRRNWTGRAKVRNSNLSEIRSSVLLFYSCGLRLAELVGIDRDDFSGDYTALKVRGKGDKERIVPILPPVREKILHYLDEIDRQGICISKEKALFLNQQGKRISRSTVYRTVQSQLRQGGVQGKKSPHVLRHTFATELLNNGADMRAIQELLGHASLQATQVYTHNSIAKLQEIYSKAHPREKNGAEQTKQQN